jgi:serine protease Do
MNKLIWPLLFSTAVLVFTVFGSILVIQNQNMAKEISALKTNIFAIEDNISIIKNNALEDQQGLGVHIAAVCNATCLVEPVVVRIEVSGTNILVSGSGIIINSNGYIITNQHVIENAQTINVSLMNGEVFSASLITGDKARDLAILKIQSDRSDFIQADLGSASDIIVGDSVIAGGFPLGLQWHEPASFTEGIVSALRNIDGLRYIQTDTATNPGNSGGCLFDLNGKVIGIITGRILDADSISLAIPIDEVIAYIEKAKLE